VWHYHLNHRDDPQSEFHKVTHILRTGDSGPHFHNRLTIEFESQVQSNYDIVWETHTLCKRHAYGPCDSAGGGLVMISSSTLLSAVKRRARHLACIGKAPIGDVAWIDMINDDEGVFSNHR
jgi:hypothetical protein